MWLSKSLYLCSLQIWVSQWWDPEVHILNKYYRWLRHRALVDHKPLKNAWPTERSCAGLLTERSRELLFLGSIRKRSQVMASLPYRVLISTHGFFWGHLGEPYLGKSSKKYFNYSTGLLSTYYTPENVLGTRKYIVTGRWRDSDIENSEEVKNGEWKIFLSLGYLWLAPLRYTV